MNTTENRSHPQSATVKPRAGKHAFLEQLVAAGVRYIFGNPGTTEQAILDAIQDYPNLEFINCLHETVAMGIAESYARATKSAAIVELHAGPGLGNAMGMIYNAWSAKIPMVIFACVPATAGAYTEPALGGPLVEMARPVSKWSYELRTPYEIPQVLRRALKVAQQPPFGPVVLILPVDILDSETDAAVQAPSFVGERIRPDLHHLQRAAMEIISANNPAIIVSDGVWSSDAVEAVESFASLIGAPVYQGYTNAVNISGDHPLNAGPLPVFYPNPYRLALSDKDVVVAIGSDAFRILFADEKPIISVNTRLIHIDQNAWELAKNHPAIALLADPRECLIELINLLQKTWSDSASEAAQRRGAQHAQDIAVTKLKLSSSPPSSSNLSAEAAIDALVGALPKDCIVYDEAITSSARLLQQLKPKAGQWFRAAGGGLGPGTTGVIGLKLAYPDRPAISIVGDGAALYTIQALWTAARYKIPAIWAVLNNSSYRVLKLNLKAYLGDTSDARSFIGTDLTDPAIDYVSLAQSFGIPAVTVETVEGIRQAVRSAFAENRTCLINVNMDRSI